MKWEGVLPAVTTPFREDLSLDLAFLKGHVCWLADSGCRGIVALGSLGEGATLRQEEKLAVLSACREEFPAALRWRTRVIGGAVTAVDEDGRPVAAEDRIGEAAENLAAWQARQGPGGAR